MAKGSTASRSQGKHKATARTAKRKPVDLQGVLWRVDRLERQVRRLSELVREHAEDSDRLVRIVAEDREVLRQQLLAKVGSTVRTRKSPSLSGKFGIASS